MSKFFSLLFVCFGLVSFPCLTLEAQRNFDSINAIDGKSDEAIITDVDSTNAYRSRNLVRLPRQTSKVHEAYKVLRSVTSRVMDENDRRKTTDEMQARGSRTEPLALSNWPSKAISQIQLSPVGGGKAPTDQSSRLLQKYVRDWSLMETREKVYSWESPNIRYQPLLFEDVALERNGQVVLNDRFQTVASAVHFFSSAALLPLHARHDPVYSCDYPLGYERPGNCTRKIFPRSFWGLNR